MRFRRNQTVLPRHMIVPFVVVCLFVPLLLATLLTIFKPGVQVVYDEALGYPVYAMYHRMCTSSYTCLQRSSFSVSAFWFLPGSFDM
mmetsp:Transcript_2147/g.4818  ORF Transcript_2147/g.4818 Transcript_2147/m.4818 type:complete len:87 (+) Transcript_2147:130-390(+)